MTDNNNGNECLLHNRHFVHMCVYMYIKHFMCIFVFKLYKGFYGENLGSYILLSPKQYSEE